MDVLSALTIKIMKKEKPCGGMTTSGKGNPTKGTNTLKMPLKAKGMKQMLPGSGKK